jgi:hypothetical protein
MTKRAFKKIENIEDYGRLMQMVDHIDDNVTHHQYLDEFDESDKTVATSLSMDSAILSAIVEKYPYHFPHPISGMNELYVSAIGSGGSDRVFETPHIDGVFAWLPGCHVLRCIVALQGNAAVCTSFQFPDETYILTTGSFLAFDYNRDIHYIWKKGSVEDTSKRVIMKLHYLMAPKGMPALVVDLYRGIHTYYNAGLRRLFLKSQQPETVVGGAISVMINGGTVLYVAVFVGVMWLRAKLFSK